MSPLASQIGARLRQLRQAAQLSQAELAARAGLSTSMVSMTERGERLPTLETLVEMLEVVDEGPFSREVHMLSRFFEAIAGVTELRTTRRFPTREDPHP